MNPAYAQKRQFSVMCPPSSILHFALICFAAATACPAATHVEAYRGEPFGIGRAIIDLQPGASAAPASDDRFIIADAQDRVLYPVMENKSTRRILRSLLGIETPLRVTFLFMFRGDEPLEIVANTPTPQKFTVRPEDDAEEFNQLLNDWWEATSDRYQQVFRQAEYPVVVDNFLTATWARRLNREMPEPSRYLFQRFGIGAPWISQLMANEAYQTQVERDLVLGDLNSNEAGMIPLPSAPRPLLGQVEGASDRATAGDQVSGDSELPAPVGAVPPSIEPLAGHVPYECFYMRFGNFPNYLWYRDFMRHWQGDIGNMVVVESVDRNISQRFQQQIAVGESKIGRIMGPTVVHDVAFIGLDAYLRDGAAMGILFQANNSVLLNSSLGKQRQDAKGKHKDAVEETVKIAGHDVSYVHTPDGRLRSYYALDGDFHLVANSRRLVERFYEAGAGKNSLATSADFQNCRDSMPLTREDTIFVFVPAEFLQNLSSPHYRVELDRRLRSVGEMRAIKLALLAAAAEGHQANSIDDLIAAELLPAGFGQRFDGSKLVQLEPSPAGSGQGEGFRDSVRGDAGWMTPIPDMTVDRITPAEARRLAKFQQDLHSSVGQFAPICLALKRDQSPANKDWDRITADVRVASYSQMPIAKWPAMLGPAASARVVPVAGDVASLEIVIDALGDPVHLFGGIRDFSTPLVVRQGAVEANAPVTEYIRAYVGGWPRPHLIDRFLGRPAGPLDADGIARTGGLFDLWFRRADDFFLFSFKRDVLMEVGRQLAIVDAERPAQIRLHIDDLSDKQIATAVSGLGYKRARDTSASASRFMNSLTTQLHVPAEDARVLGEDLVGGKFACPLGGKYVLVDPSVPLTVPGEGRGAATEGALPVPDGAVASATVNNAEQLPAPGEPASGGGRKLWVTTATAPENRFLLTVIPADYQMPLLAWFRGLSADVARVNDELRLNAQLDMVHIEVGPPEDPEGAGGGGLNLPSLGNLFSGFGKKTDEQVKPASTTEEAPALKK